MERTKFEQWSMDYLAGTLAAEEKKVFEALLLREPKYQKEWKEMQKAWIDISAMAELEPSIKMDDKFYQLLASTASEAQEKKLGILEAINLFISQWVRPQLAYGMLLLVIGLGIGYYANSIGVVKTDVDTTEIVSKDSNIETSAVREKLVLTLLEQPSANKRLEGVNEANKLKKVETKVVQALLKTLNNDPNVNVRLAAIESLTQFVEIPEVREGLVQSIIRQDAPIVQITLANLMEGLQERSSVEPLKQLMQTKEFDTTVKKEIKNSIYAII